MKRWIYPQLHHCCWCNMRFVVQGEHFVLASNYKPLWEMRGTAVIWKPGIFPCLAFFWLVSSATVYLEWLCSQKYLINSFQRRRSGPTCKACRQPESLQRRTNVTLLPSPNAPCIVAQARELADGQCFPVALSCVLLYSKGPEGLQERFSHVVYLLLPTKHGLMKAATDVLGLQHLSLLLILVTGTML